MNVIFRKFNMKTSCAHFLVVISKNMNISVLLAKGYGFTTATWTKVVASTNPTTEDTALTTSPTEVTHD